MLRWIDNGIVVFAIVIGIVCYFVYETHKRNEAFMRALAIEKHECERRGGTRAWGRCFAPGVLLDTDGADK